MWVKSTIRSSGVDVRVQTFGSVNPRMDDMISRIEFLGMFIQTIVDDKPAYKYQRPDATA